MIESNIFKDQNRNGTNQQVRVGVFDEKWAKNLENNLNKITNFLASQRQLN